MYGHEDMFGVYATQIDTVAAVTEAGRGGASEVLSHEVGLHPCSGTRTFAPLPGASYSSRQ